MRSLGDSCPTSRSSKFSAYFTRLLRRQRGSHQKSATAIARRAAAPAEAGTRRRHLVGGEESGGGGETTLAPAAGRFPAGRPPAWTESMSVMTSAKDFCRPFRSRAVILSTRWQTESEMLPSLMTGLGERKSRVALRRRISATDAVAECGVWPVRRWWRVAPNE